MIATLMRPSRWRQLSTSMGLSASWHRRRWNAVCLDPLGEVRAFTGKFRQCRAQGCHCLVALGGTDDGGRGEPPSAARTW